MPQSVTAGCSSCTGLRSGQIPLCSHGTITWGSAQAGTHCLRWLKATLITHHLLFVGFGLEDDHFHEIVHDVRRALPDESKAKPELATALTLFRDPLDDRAWKDKLTLIPMSRGTDVGVAARTLEIFLDLLLARATDSHSYLLADGYEEALSEEELSLRTKLLRLTHGLTAAEVNSSGGMRLLKMLRELGG